MPKQTYKITQFHGGLNSSSDPRDIAENELSDATDIAVDELGKVRMMGGNATHGEAPAQAADIEPGYGLFQFSHDRLEGETAGTAAAETGDDYLAMVDADGAANVDIYSRVADAWGNAKFDFGSTTGAKASFYFVDGALRCADGNFGAGNKPMWYGYVDRKFFGNDISGFDVGGNFDNGILVDGWESDDAAPIALQANIAGGSTAINVTSPDASTPVSVQLLMTSDVKNYKNVVSSGDAISTTVKVLTQGTFAEADDTFTVTGGNTDWDVDEFCSVGDRLMFAAADEDDNNQTLFTVTAIDAGAPNVLTFAEDVTADTNDQVQITNLSRTAWLDTFKDGISIGVTTLYGDEKQESKIFVTDLDFYNIQNVQDRYPDEVGFYFHVFVGDGSSTGLWKSDPRVSGFNIYLRAGTSYSYTQTNSDWYLYGEIDISDGSKQVDSDRFINWQSSNAGGTCGTDTAFCIVLKRSSPTTLIRYKDKTGFDFPPHTVGGNSSVKEIGVAGAGAGWKTAVVTNRRAYIGNVTIKNAHNSLEHFGDAILKSPVNKFDSFTLENRLEATIKDGDEIIKLEAYADRLLEFKKKRLTLINISQDVEFIEDTFMHKGVSHPAAVCKTDFGIAWVNSEGCYLYDGQKVNNLLEKGGRQIIKESEWTTFTTNDTIPSAYEPMIGYIPKKRQLVVVDDSSSTGTGKTFLYDMVTQSWVKGADAMFTSADLTNFVTDWNNDLIHANTSDTGTILKWDDTTDPSSNMVITTKDIDFGEPAVRKKIYKVYITYRGNATHVQVHYGINGLAPALTFNNITSGSDGSSTGSGSNAKCIPYDAGVTDWLKAELKPSASINNINSFRLKLSGDGSNNIAADFEINDISIVYRGKNVK